MANARHFWLYEIDCEVAKELKYQELTDHDAVCDVKVTRGTL